jgi:beta-lactamase superfamily II metal-dependent hydrolase
MDPRITYFPVGNGDCSLITLSDNTQIVIDCNTTEEASDETDDSRYDVHQHLLDFGKKLDGKIPHVDVFVLTHADQDHCRGFDNMFYTGDPAKYTLKHSKEDLILIDELWFTHRIFVTHDGPPSKWAKAFEKEAQRRIDLHKKNSPDRHKAGNRIRVIGQTKNPAYQGLGDLVITPGNYINVIDRKPKKDFKFFVHAPFRKEVDSKLAERNKTSVVLQAVFDVDGTERAGLALFGGDADAPIWSKILELSEDETLQYDLLLAPHHCSWTFFSDSPYKENKVPAKDSLAILGKGMKGARIIASCKPIKDDDDNPPHFAAKEEYEKVVGKKNFISLSEVGNVKRPLPTTFEMSANGPVLLDPNKVEHLDDTVKKVASTPQTYG